MEIKSRYNLKHLNTFAIDATARFFVEVNSKGEAMEALAHAKKNNLPVFILGGGSNIVLSDKGWEGLVIHNKIPGIEIQSSGKAVVGAGENWDDVVLAAVRRNFSGIECLTGVPGSSGGAAVQNIGCYGQTLADVLVEAAAVEVETGRERNFKNAELELGYRTSIFKKNPGKWLVTEIVLQLGQNKPTLTYHDVKKYFDGRPSPTLEQVRNALIEIRAAKGMVIMPGYEVYKSDGSFFMNPIIPPTDFEVLKTKVNLNDDRPWYWPEGGNVKISAAKLISLSGFEKGYSEGPVGISPKQPMAIINLGNARAADIKALAGKIKQAVWDKFSVKLQEEVLFVGEI